MRSGRGPLGDGEIQRRRERLVDFLDAWGDLRVRDLGGDRERRLLEFSLEAPGHDLPVEVRAEYGEHYRRRRDGRWLLVGYRYECLGVAHGWRLAYHMHDIGRLLRAPHAHCTDAIEPADVEGTRHLRAVELDLREAHVQFMRLYASDSPPDCSDYLPLEIRRDR